MKTSRILPLGIALVLMVACGKTTDSNEKIHFETYKASHSEPCPFDKSITCFDAQFQVALPNADDSKANEAIRRTLVTDIFGEKFVRIANDKLLEAYIAEMKEEYEHNDVEGDELSFSNFSVDNVEAAPIFVGDKLISYESTRYTYSGGAHGMTAISCWVFDLESGNQLTEDDIFVSNYAENLTDLIKQALTEEAAKNNIPLDSYQMGEVVPNGNFVITDEGLYYQFNPYDIAPYAIGSTRLLITKSSLLPLLKEGTIVSELFAK